MQKIKKKFNLNMTVFDKFTCEKKPIKTKGIFCRQFHNVLRFFNVSPNFPFNSSETIGDYYFRSY